MTNIITPTLIADKLGLSVSDQDIGRAQTVIETIMDVNLSDAAIFADNLLRDQRSLQRAVMWQTAFLEEHPDALYRMTDVAQARSNDNAIVFREGVEAGYLSPLAAKSLARLSWYGRTGGTSIPTRSTCTPGIWRRTCPTTRAILLGARCDDSLGDDQDHGEAIGSDRCLRHGPLGTLD